MQERKQPTSTDQPPLVMLPPPPPIRSAPAWDIPDDRRCAEYWLKFGMAEHIMEHSLTVARVATRLAQAAEDMGLSVNVAAVRASALLHDIAKTYCILHGGDHSQVGGAWALSLTRNPAIASGVLHHVYWPWEMDLKSHFLPLAVQYADKRVRHDTVVTMDSRFDDLYERYGATPYIRSRIRETHDQAHHLESLLSTTLKVDLNACDFTGGRLV